MRWAWAFRLLFSQCNCIHFLQLNGKASLLCLLYRALIFRAGSHRPSWPRPTTIFGSVPLQDLVRYSEIHTRHHIKQMAARH